jgi:ATP-binding cassette subfamily B protein
LAIARALVRRPRLLVLDEPTNHLDRDAIIEILDNLARVPRRPSILIVSHHEHAVDIADRVVHLRDGRAEQPPASAPSCAVDDVKVRKLS